MIRSVKNVLQSWKIHIAAPVIAIIAIITGIVLDVAILAHKAGKPLPFISISSGGEFIKVDPYAFCNPTLDHCVMTHKIYNIKLAPGQAAIISLPPQIYFYPWSYIIQYAGKNRTITRISPLRNGKKTPHTFALISPKDHPIIAVQFQIGAVALIQQKEEIVFRAQWGLDTLKTAQISK